MSHVTRRASLCVLLVLFMLFAAVALPAPAPKLPEPDRIRLAEAFRLADSLDGNVWKGWEKTPFIVLLVTPDTEFLVHHPQPDTSFTLSGYDSLLKSNVYARPRVFPPTLLASFPFDGMPTTAIGQAENTDAKTSTPWVVTLLHEHFHQLQYGRKEYYEQVNALNLSGGDKTGMWMLNYPFPYDSASVKAGFDRLKMALNDAVTAPDSQLSAKFSSYGKVRREFFSQLREPDHKYMSFQLWQEGVARYTELRVAEWADSHFQPSAAFQALLDYLPFSARVKALRFDVEKMLPDVKLAGFQRVAFYYIGSAEAVLLDRVNPSWRDSYFTNLLTLDPYFTVKP